MSGIPPVSEPGKGHAESCAEAFLRLLAARGIPYVFGNAGTDFAPLIEAFARLARRGGPAPLPVTVPHENLGMAMAHGCYLATGRPQAVMVHVNVGTANALCGLWNAAREHIPILLAAGRTPITEQGAFGSRNVFIHWGQEMFDQAGMVRESVKWEYELRTPEQVEAVVDRALGIAQSAPRGPVYLTLPREVLGRTADPAAAEPPQYRRPASSPAPDLQAVAQAAGWLAAAENPLIVTASFGREVADVPVLASLSERHALPVVAYRPRYVCLPTGHPLHLGHEPGPFLAAADVIVVLDCDVPWVPELHRVNPRARVIHIGADPLFARYPMRSFRCDLAIAADPAATLAALDEALSRSPGRDEARIGVRRKRVARARAEARARRPAAAAPSGEGPVTAATLAAALTRVKRPHDLVVNETASLPIGLLEFSEPGTYFGVGGAGGLGWGLGAALGLKLGARDRRVICLVGDGAYMFGNPTPAHLVSAAMDLPTLTIIVNNRMWGAVRRATLSLYPAGAAAEAVEPVLTALEPSPEYQRVVEASGGYGEKVERAADLDGALARALHAVETEGRQAVLNVLVPYTDAQALRDAGPRPR
jgi:acetolactate synthase-1/2/3 large subunit